MAKRDIYRRLEVSSGHRKALIALSVIEIILAIASIGVAITAIILSRQTYIDCNTFLENSAAGTSCPIYPRLNTYSLTAQGIWEGVLILMSAAIAIDFTRYSSWISWSYMSGFGSIASTLSGGMITLEAFAVTDYISGGYQNRGNYDYILWCLHVGLLSAACAIWVISTSKSIVISRVRSRARVAISDSELSLQPPPPAVYRITA